MGHRRLRIEAILPRADHLLARLHMCMDVSRRRRRRVQNEREIIVIITINSFFSLSLSMPYLDRTNAYKELSIFFVSLSE